MNPLFGTPVTNPLFGGGGSSGGFGEGFGNFMSSPMTLAALQMMSNNQPRVGQPINTMEGVPQMLMAGFSAQDKKRERESEKRALTLALKKAGFSDEEAQGLSVNTTAAAQALQWKKSAADDARADKQFATQQAQWNASHGLQQRQLELSEGRFGREIENREQVATRLGLTGRERDRYVATGDMPLTSVQSPPAGYRWAANGSSLEKIPGGPAEKEGTIAPENAGRAALTNTFLRDVPMIRKDLDQTVGWLDRPFAELGWGRPGEVQRQLKSGSDALYRALTGAGMPQGEALERAERYLPTKWDNTASITSKFDQLTKELKEYQKLMYQGRGTAPDDGTPPENMSREKLTDTARSGVAPGKVMTGNNGKQYRYLGGDPSDKNNWAPL